MVEEAAVAIPYPQESAVAERQQSAFRADLEKYYRIGFQTTTPSLSHKLRLWALHFGLHCVAVYRLHRYAQRLKQRWPLAALPLVMLALFLKRVMAFVHHVEIEATIGPGFYLGHAASIYIGPTVIGRNFSATHNVTVGHGHAVGAKGLPVIGDDVWVGTGSVLSGAIRVGDRVTIANGTMLSRDLPSGCLAGGNPGRVVLARYDNRALLGEAGPTGDAA